MKFHNSVITFKKKNEKIYLSGIKKLLAFLFCSSIFFISFLFPLFQMIFWSITFPNLLDFSEIIKINLNSMKLIFLSSTLIIFLSLFVNFGTRVLKSNFFNFFFKSFNCWICNTWNSYICSNYNFFFFVG